MLEDMRQLGWGHRGGHEPAGLVGLRFALPVHDGTLPLAV
jgi:hypothetical protein